MVNNDRNQRHGKKRTSKIIDRLTYSPKKHKNKKRREMTEKLQAMVLVRPKDHIPVIKETLKFGSFNVNGLDIEARWAVEQIINTRGFDVSSITSV